MATKTQKRQAQKHKDEVKAASERMANLNSADIAYLENYAVYQILYINDCAYNCCKFLGDELKTIPYKSKAVQTVYGALMKRWNAYHDFIASAKIDMGSIANLFSEMDDYFDGLVDGFRKAVEKVMTDNNVEHAHWVASCETASVMCDYASHVAQGFVARLSKVSKNITHITPMIIREHARVMGNMDELVASIHVKSNIDLNIIPEVQTAFRHLNKAFLNPENFKKAQTTADEENAAEGRMTIM